MTGLHFLAAGVRITLSRDSLDYVVEGPVDRPELARELAWEVSTRLDLVGTSPTLPPGTQREWCCDLCGDAIGHGPREGSCPLCPDRCMRAVHGLCVLCALARRKALREADR
mgnify:CR=1 FL=1